MTNILKIIPREFRSKSSMGIILIAAILVEVTSGVQYWYSKKVIQSGVESRAKGDVFARAHVSTNNKKTRKKNLARSEFSAGRKNVVL